MVYYEYYFDDARDVEIKKKIVTIIEPKMIEEHHDDLQQIETDELSLFDDLEIVLFES
jgi:hypothetical protein